MNFAQIETLRLILRKLRPEDITEKYLGWLNDPEINRYLETRHVVQTLDSCREFVEKCNTTHGEHLFGVFLKSSDEHIGNAKIGFVNEHYKRGQLSLLIGEKKYWGKGYSTELVSALTEYAFNQLGLIRVEAGCYEDNLASLRVFLKCGYTVEGFFRNHVILDGKPQGGFWLGKLIDEH